MLLPDREAARQAGGATAETRLGSRRYFPRGKFAHSRLGKSPHSRQRWLTRQTVHRSGNLGTL